MNQRRPSHERLLAPHLSFPKLVIGPFRDVERKRGNPIMTVENLGRQFLCLWSPSPWLDPGGGAVGHLCPFDQISVCPYGHKAAAKLATCFVER